MSYGYYQRILCDIEHNFLLHTWRLNHYVCIGYLKFGIIRVQKKKKIIKIGITPSSLVSIKLLISNSLISIFLFGFVDPTPGALMENLFFFGRLILGFFLFSYRRVRICEFLLFFF